ncbi:MAG TPA: protein translocase subunit SecD [Candidatus Brocadiia bacterium]|nr:protein translocase subunit SecD [Candidatus Brocadiia bacterium]
MPKETMSRLYVKLGISVAVVLLLLGAFLKMHVRRGLDLSGGTELLYRIRVENIPPSEQSDITQRTIDIIRRRVDPRGTEQLDIRPRGKFRFYIQIPHRSAEDAERIETRLQKAGNLMFCIVEQDGLDKALRGERVPGTTVFIQRVEKSPTGKGAPRERYYKATFQQLAELEAAHKAGGPEVKWLLVQNKPVTTGKYLSRVYPTVDQSFQRAVGFELFGKGRNDFADATQQYKGRQLAIVLDDVLYSAPKIEEKISGSGIIRGQFSERELADLITTLQAGTLPADIQLEWKHVVGPALGQDSIQKGQQAIVLAAVLVLAFMVVYYLTAGVVAALTQVMNLFIILGLMALLRVTLTLPGMAGLALTLGMAVDANVLIFERIREELSRGKGLRLAVKAGFDRALVTIVDSNLTTLITALILFGVGTGPVRGFAVTLSIGLLSSMFVALVISRQIFDVMLEGGWVRKLPMLQLFRQPMFCYSRVRYAAISASAILIIAGLVVYWVRGADKYDTDLRGGIMADIELDKGMATAEFRKRVVEKFGAADVQELKTEEAGLPRRFLVRLRDMSHEPEFQAAKLQRDLQALLVSNGVGTAAGVTRIEGNTFELKLDKAVDEGALRAMLVAAGYRRPDVEALIAQTAKAENFVFYLKESRLDRQDPDRHVGATLEALGDLVVKRTVQVDKVGQVTVEEKEQGARIRDVQDRLEFSLQDACDVSAVREALMALCFKGRRPKMSVNAAERDETGGKEAKAFQLRGAADDLKQVRDTLESRKAIDVASFRQVGASEIQVALKSPQTEQQIRERLEAAVAVAKTLEPGVVEAVLPLGAAETRFTARMASLPEAKALEKIREDLLGTFKDELASKTYKVTFTPAEAPAFVSKPDQEGFKFFVMKLDREAPAQEIVARLTRAGRPDAAVIEGDMRAVAQKNMGEMIIKLRDDGELKRAQDEIASSFATPNPFQRLESVGQVVAGEMRNKAILATIVSMIAIIIYIWLRFGELKFGVAAVVALVHDVLFTMGAVAVADALAGTFVGRALGFSDIKINVEMIAAFLTIVGYSLNDTIVVFDRIRENMGGARRRVDAEMVDTSVDQTLSRTVLTALTTLFVLFVLYVAGGSVIHGFAFAMLFGVIIGTYSSIFIASPILIDWEKAVAGVKKAFRVVTFRFD